MNRHYVTALIGKCISKTSRYLHLGAGATWPGEIALTLDPTIISHLSGKLRKGIILVAGTNGKTTTTRMIQTLIESHGETVIHNKSGANLINGIASALLDVGDDTDWGVFEVDENSLPHVLRFVSPKMIVLLNLFRDQLDRYGEVDVISEKWEHALQNLAQSSTLILNADDPQIAYLGHSWTGKKVYFGLDDPSIQTKVLEHATDSIFCMKCGARLQYDGIYYSHLGLWKCASCGLHRPKPQVTTFTTQLSGVYNRYNAQAAAAVGQELRITDTNIQKALRDVTPAFGRQETFVIDGKNVVLVLSKNPASFNESLRTVQHMGAREILLILNDRIPDGTDVSWIWDVDFEMLSKDTTVLVSGDRVYDLAVRCKHAYLQAQVYESLREAIQFGLSKNRTETLYILATYSGMLDARKILHGQQIL